MKKRTWNIHSAKIISDQGICLFIFCKGKGLPDSIPKSRYKPEVNGMGEDLYVTIKCQSWTLHSTLSEIVFLVCFNGI